MGDVYDQGAEITGVDVSNWFTDPDGDALTYRVDDTTTWPDGLSLNTTTGEISGTIETPGEHVATFIAIDPDGATASVDYTFTVRPAPANLAPVFSPFSMGQILDGSVFDFDISQYISDPDGDAFNIYVDPNSLPTGLGFDANTGRISGTVDAGFDPYVAGNGASFASYDIQIFALDEHGAELAFTRSLVVKQDISLPPPEVTIDDLTLYEDGIEKGLVVRLSHAVDYDINLRWNIKDSSSAWQGFDYLAPDGEPVIFIPKGGETGLLRLTALPDDIVEGIELIEFEFTTDPGQEIIDNGNHIVRLEDSSTAPLTGDGNLLSYMAAALGFAGRIADAQDYIRDLYDQGIKYVASLTFLGSVNVLKSGVDLSKGFSIDLADLFGVTPEGLGGYDGNPNGKVSFWAHADYALKMGIDVVPDITPVDVGIAVKFTPIEFSSLTPDDRTESTIGWFIGGNLLGLGAQIGQTGSTATGVGFFDLKVSAKQSMFEVFLPLEDSDGYGFAVRPTDIVKFEVASGAVGIEVGRTTSFNEFDRQWLLDASLLNTVLSVYSAVDGAFSVGDGMSGTAADETIVGTVEGDHITGEGGNDQLFGREGDDLLYADGPVIADVLKLSGGIGQDTLIYGATKYWDAQGGLDSDIYIADLPRLQTVIDSGVTAPGVNIFDEGGDEDEIWLVSDWRLDADEDVSFKLDKAGTLTITTANMGLFGSQDEVLITVESQTTAAHEVEYLNFTKADDTRSVYEVYARRKLPHMTDDKIIGSNSNDILYGGESDDTIIDGLGDNSLSGGNGHDRLVTHSGIGGLSGGGSSDFIIGGFQADFLDGGEGDDVLRGDASNGLLGGSDVIYGGTGDDIMMGGRGADTFVFAPNDDTDTIAAFNTADVTFDPSSGFTVSSLTQDYRPGVDHVRLAAFAAVDESNVMSMVSSGSNGAVFSAEGTSIVFYGVSVDQLSADDFLFL